MKTTTFPVAAAAMFTPLLFTAFAAHAADVPEAWRQPVKPFHIVGNIYYVGMKGISAYLITSGKQAVLLDATLKENAPAIEKHIEALGFKLSDVKILINSHAHYDHAGGLAMLKADTGATLVASKADQWGLEHGAQDGDINYTPDPYPPVKVDRSFKTTTRVDLGDIHLKGLVTPGHTKGCTTWSLTIVEKGRPLDVVFPCGLTVAGNRLVGNKAYPGIVADFRHTFDTLERMKADVVLTGHPEQSDVMERQAKAEAGNANAFIDSQMLQRMAVRYRQAFEKELAKAKGIPGRTPRHPALRKGRHLSHLLRSNSHRHH
jgi:metallo-beta-lactamase class B